MTRIMKCARCCTHPAQDRLHGAGLRLHNLVAEEGGLALHRLSRLDPWKGEQAMTRTDRQDRERARVLLWGLLALALAIAYYVVPVLLWGPEP